MGYPFHLINSWKLIWEIYIQIYHFLIKNYFDQNWMRLGYPFHLIKPLKFFIFLEICTGNPFTNISFSNKKIFLLKLGKIGQSLPFGQTQRVTPYFFICRVTCYITFHKYYNNMEIGLSLPFNQIQRVTYYFFFLFIFLKIYMGNLYSNT